MSLAAVVPAALHEALDRAGYDEERIAAALRVDPPAGAGTAVANLRRLTGDDPLAVLVRLFLAGEPVSRADAERALTPRGLEDAVASGLVRADDILADAMFALVEWHGLRVAHDHERAMPLRADHVTGIGNATRTLAAMTVRRAGGRALDLGTGCGAQALLTARHAGEVVATDLNPRALELARTNLRLNGVDNVELREGSFFEPVAGERFDLIVTNPPFVISPDAEYVFRDAGLERDDLSRMIVAQLPEHLADGGFASTLACWIHAEDDDWSAPVRRWVEDSGCDALVVRYVSDDPISYGVKWAEGETADRWIAHYVESGVERFVTGAVVLRRRADDREPWFAAADAERGPTGSASDQLLRIFAAHDFAGDLLDERLVLAPHRLEERLIWTDAGYRPEFVVLRLDDGAGVAAHVDPAALPALFRLNGERPLRELPGAEDALPTIRRLFELGFVGRV